MDKILHTLTTSRLFCRVALLCYLVISLVLPFQHQHLGDEALLTSSLLRPSKSLHTIHSSVNCVVVSKAKVAHSSHCLACEWQNTDTTASLSVITTGTFTLSASLVATTFPRYLNQFSPQSVSRGPPVV